MTKINLQERSGEKLLAKLRRLGKDVGVSQKQRQAFLKYASLVAPNTHLNILHSANVNSDNSVTLSLVVNAKPNASIFYRIIFYRVFLEVDGYYDGTRHYSENMYTDANDQLDSKYIYSVMDHIPSEKETEE